MRAPIALIALCGLLAGCSIFKDAAPVQPHTFCPHAVHPSDDARAWLAQQHPPAPVNEYLYKIGIQQRDIDLHCK